MELRAEFTGEGYIDPDLCEQVVPSCRIAIQVAGMPAGLDTGKVEAWLRMEMATICTILCSYVINPLYRSLVDLNIRYRESVMSMTDMICSGAGGIPVV